jgi:ABC-2 type transport system permease protein
MSYRALFGWLSPWIMIPGFFIVPIFQILLFTYIGRAAHLQSDSFFVIGNAIERAAVPCLFAMAATISGERWQQTLEPILATPAPRLPLFVGRSFPVILNGAAVSAFALTIGSLVLGVHIPASAIAPLALVILCYRRLLHWTRPGERRRWAPSARNRRTRQHRRGHPARRLWRQCPARRAP